MLDAFEVRAGVERLHRDALGSLANERVGIGAPQLLLGQLTPVVGVAHGVQRRGDNRPSTIPPVDEHAVPDRRQLLLAPLGDLSRIGLEIGALHHPIVERSRQSQMPSANVLYVDHADTAALQAKYADHAEVDEMVDVDVVWGDGVLADALGDRGPVGWVVASHVLEHVPNLVGWLDQLADVMLEGAVLSLAVPDKRYCFDIRRRET